MVFRSSAEDEKAMCFICCELTVKQRPPRTALADQDRSRKKKKTGTNISTDTLNVLIILYIRELERYWQYRLQEVPH